MVSAICGVNLLDKFKNKSLIDMLGLKETLETFAKAGGVRWFGHVIRRDERNVLRKALTFKDDGSNKKGGPKVKWKNKIVSKISEVGL